MAINHIGQFVRSYRQANNETLQTLAERSGVSKSMISDIESGQKSPTIAVLSKLANAMSISLEALVRDPSNDRSGTLFSASIQNKISRPQSAFCCHQLVSLSASAPLDIYQFYFLKHGKTSFAANPSTNTIKYISIEVGYVDVHQSSKVTRVKSGEILEIDATTPHRFENRSGALAKGTLIVGYTK